MRIKCGHTGCDKAFKSMAGRAAHRRWMHGIPAQTSNLTAIEVPTGDPNGIKEIKETEEIVENINKKVTQLQVWALQIAHELLDVKLGVRTLAEDEARTLNELREILTTELSPSRTTSHDTSHDMSHAVRTAS